MKAYYVKYITTQYGEEKGIDPPADSAADAYDKAVYEMIPEREGRMPYAAYVYSVTYNNGNHRIFRNNMYGKPY